MEKEERIYWVDQTKALGLLVVMLVHSPIPLLLEHYFRSFSIPRFFIIAGLFLRFDQPFHRYFKAKAMRLVVPYFFYSFVSYLIWLFAFRQISLEDALLDPLTPFLWILYGNGGGNMVHNRPLWFLPSLFTALMLVYFMVRIPRPYVYGVMVLSAILGHVLMESLSFRPPWGMDIMFTTGALTTLGCLFRKEIVNSKPLPWPWLIFWSVVSITTAFSNIFVRLSGADVGNFFLFYIAAFAGSLVTLDISKRIPYNRFLSYIGRHTLPIYAMHIVVYMFLYEFFKRLPTYLANLHLAEVIQTESAVFMLIKLAIFLIAGYGIPLLLMHAYNTAGDRFGFLKSPQIIDEPQLSPKGNEKALVLPSVAAER